MNGPKGEVKGGAVLGQPRTNPCVKLSYWHAAHNVAIKQSVVIMKD